MASQPVAITSTRDLVRFRKLPSPAIQNIATAFLSHLSADSAAAAQLRAAFFPAITGTDTRPRDPVQLEAIDSRLRDHFSNPPNIVIPQGIITTNQLVAAWGDGEKSGTAMANSIFIAFALHQELITAKEDGERVHEANLGIMVIATLAHELAQWIYCKAHGLDGSLFHPSDAASVRTNDTGLTNASTTSVQRMHDRNDVGDKAVLGLLGCDYELLTYTIGSKEVTKRRFPSRRTPSLTPPIIYAIIGDTPAIVDITGQPPTITRRVPPWRDQEDTMYSVMSVLAPRGMTDFHGKCSIGLETGPEFEVRFDREKM